MDRLGMITFASGARASLGLVFLASLAAMSAGCGAQQVHFALGPTKVCGRILTSNPLGVTQFRVHSGQRLKLGPDVLAFDPTHPGAAEGPIALRLATGCAIGALGIKVTTPAILKLGNVVRGTRSGIVAVLVYGIGNGTGTLTVNEASGKAAFVAIPVPTG